MVTSFRMATMLRTQLDAVSLGRPLTLALTSPLALALALTLARTLTLIPSPNSGFQPTLTPSATHSCPYP